MRKFETGAQRDDDTGKPKASLLPHSALLRVMRQFEAGVNLYGEDNWKKGIPPRSYYDSAMRHLITWWMNREAGVESREDHLAAVCFNVMALMWELEQTREADGTETHN